MTTRSPRIPDAALAKIPGKALYRMATAGAEVVIGGEHPSLVLPEARASKWGGECWLRVRHADADDIDRADKEAKVQGKSLKAAEKASLRTEKGKPGLDIPTPGKGRRHEIREGSLKWDVVYESPAALPADGIERFQLEFPAGLTWHYQPELTPEEIAEGAERPENVVGSYAGYFDRSGRIIDANGEEIANYETGKFAHLYRPEMIDAAGNRCWAEQELVGSELRITLPAEWMATAVYPVRLDPTFGYDSNGGSSIGLTPGYIRANINGQAASNGSASKITAWLTYFNLSANGVVGARATCGIYDVSGSVPTSLITNGATAETASSVNIRGASTQFDFNFSPPPSITADTDYALAIHATNTSGSFAGYIKYDTAGGSGAWSLAETYTAGSLPSPFPSVSPSSSTARYSIYATYEESGGGGTLIDIRIDTWNAISSSFSVNTDSILKASNSESDIFDSRTNISSEEVELIDASCSISSSSEYYVDLKAALSTLEEELLDTTTNISTLAEIVHYFDTKTEIHSLLTKLLDSSSSISNEELQQLDTKAAISNIIDKLVDSKFSVSSELLNSIDSKTEVKTVTINLIDTNGKISSSASVELDSKSKVAVELVINIDTDTYISMLNSIVIRLDTKAAVANEEIFYIDLIDRISTNESVQFDSLTKALESILVSTDLRSSVSNDEIYYIDLNVPVSNKELAILDLKASISNQAIIITDSITAASFQLIESIDTLTHIHATSTTSISLDTLIKVYEEVSSYTDLKLFVATNGLGIVTDPRIEVLTKLFGITDATNSIGIESLTKVREIQALENP